MSSDAAEAWPQEIRDFLVGRLATGQRSFPLAASHEQVLRHPPIRRWWVFEGKRYPSIGGTLASRWVEAIRAVRLLRQTFNPRLKISERPEGTVDWGQTLARGPSGPNPEYVVRSTGVGLGPEEDAALAGWMRWIAEEWEPYAARFGVTMPTPAREALNALGAHADGVQVTVDQLRQWAHVARRSRWPLLRDLVAESLRPMLEPAELDHVPLPTDRASLFELLCLVRVARQLAPPPDELRWLDRELTGNMLTLSGATCWYQQSLDRRAVLSTPDFEEGLAESAPVFGLRVPQRIDLAFDLDPPRRGIDGILVEAKSGSQGFDTAVPQLRVYRRARPRRAGARYLVWGIVEQPPGGPITSEQLDWLRHEIEHGERDVWAFSGVDSIGEVLQVLGCRPAGEHAQVTPRCSVETLAPASR